MLPLAQTADGICITRVHHQVKSTEAFHGDDLAASDEFDGVEQGVVVPR